MLLSSNESNKKTTERYERALLELKPYRRQTRAINTLQSLDAEAYARATYLYQSTSMPYHENTKVSYCPLGEDFFSALLADLQKAEHFILMEYFVVEEGKMWDAIHEVLREKAAQGILVYFMYDDFGCMITLPERYYKQLCGEEISN